MNNINFSSEDFLEDVKFQIKAQYKNLNNYDKCIHYSRKTLNRVLNSGDEISISWIKLFCLNLYLKMEDYMYLGPYSLFCNQKWDKTRRFKKAGILYVLMR